MELPLDLRQLKGLGLYEVSYDVAMMGKYYVHFLLSGQDITGSPAVYTCTPGQPLGSKSRLQAPAEPPIINQQVELLLVAIDKYGNKLDRGGARIDARASGPGVAPMVSRDNGDGTYAITFSASVVGETRVTVRLDNVEMNTLKVVFVDGGEGKKGKGKAARDAEAEDNVDDKSEPGSDLIE